MSPLAESGRDPIHPECRELRMPTATFIARPSPSLVSEFQRANGAITRQPRATPWFFGFISIKSPEGASPKRSADHFTDVAKTVIR